jgi:hypothetical protein
MLGYDIFSMCCIVTQKVFSNARLPVIDRILYGSLASDTGRQSAAYLEFPVDTPYCY